VSATATLPVSRRAETAPRVALWRIPRTRSLLFLSVVGAVCGLLIVAARLYTDLLWFDELDQTEVYWTTLRWKLLAGAVPGLGTACLVLANLAIAGRATELRRYQLIRPAVALACGLLAFELRSGDAWQRLLVWTHRGSFGVQDPLFHHDIGFFVFSLPLYRETAAWLLESIVMAAVVTLAAYKASGAFGAEQRREVRRSARAHVLVLAAALLAVLAWRFRLEQYALALPHDPVAPGATYSDETVRLPALRLLSIFALGGAAGCLFACVRRVPVVVVAVLALGAVLALVAKSDLPAAVDRLGVQPQALSRERPHVAHAIEFTRRAYGLDRVAERELSTDATLTRSDLADERRAIANVPLWDQGVLKPALNDLQSIAGYYDFPSVSVDRYRVDGRTDVMTVGARQLALRRLAPGDRSWANDRFAYTHGYGVVAMRGSEADSDRYPRFAQREFGAPADPLRVREPRVYFGEQPDSDPPYVVLNTGRAEVDKPAPGDRVPGYHYDGTGGVGVSDPLRRLAFATRFADLDLLLTPTVDNGSRIVVHRNVRDRVRLLAPFLRWDDRPQTAVIDGRVQFLFDGYTTSDTYPYSAQVDIGGDVVNYVHAAARAAVDAFSGRVTIYAADPPDPIVRAWQEAYPGLIQPASRMPAEMREHLRYPAQLLAAQTQAYETYHAKDATAFWNGSDAWARARQLAGPVEDAGRVHFPGRRGEPVKPSYLLARLPGDRAERFMLVTPFTPHSGQNLVSYLAGSLDTSGSPELTLLSVPRDRLMLGPTQATRRILSSPGVVGYGRSLSAALRRMAPRRPSASAAGRSASRSGRS
jgi:uncharacterized protein